MRFSQTPYLLTGEIPKNGYGRNSFQDFQILKEYLYNTDESLNEISPRLRRVSIREVLINTLNYYMPIYNFYKHLKIKRRVKSKVTFPWNEDLFSNTIFQNEKNKNEQRNI